MLYKIKSFMLISALFLLLSGPGCSYKRNSITPTFERNRNSKSQVRTQTHSQTQIHAQTQTQVKTDNRASENAEDRREQKKQNPESSGTVLLDVPIISQTPELTCGCEITCLAMMMQYAGINADKMALAQNIKKDETPLIMDNYGNTVIWGNPNDGFVGDITGKQKGFGVYPKPMIQLMEKYMPGRTLNLTGYSFEALTDSIKQGRPVIVWVTIDFQYPDKYEEWSKNGVLIRATFDEHAVLLTGFDENNCYINNPYNGIKNQAVSKSTFIEIWNTMCNMAVSYE